MPSFEVLWQIGGPVAVGLYMMYEMRLGAIRELRGKIRQLDKQNRTQSAIIVHLARAQEQTDLQMIEQVLHRENLIPPEMLLRHYEEGTPQEKENAVEQ